MRTTTLRLALAGLILTSLTACSGGGSSGGKDDAPMATSSTTDGATPVAGGTLRLGMRRPVTFAPGLANPGSHVDLMVADLLYDGLTTTAADGTVGPAVATAWTPSSDQKVWTFTLDPGRTFSNGKPINAAAVKASLQRVAKLGDASFNAARLEDVAGYGPFVGGQAGDLAGVKAVDDHTVEIDLDRPLAVLPQVLASPVFGIWSLDAMIAADAKKAGPPITSSGLVPGDVDASKLVLHRPKGAPGYLSGVELRFYDDDAAAYKALTKDDVDWATVPPDKLGDARNRYGDSGLAPFHAELFFGLNLRNPKFADLRFRQAIVKGIDRAAIVKAAFADVADPLAGLVPAGVIGHTDDPCGEPCAYDANRAKQLVGEVFGTNPVTEVFIDYDESPTQRTVAGIVEKQLEAIGIPATQRPRPFAEYQSFAASGDKELFAFGWIGLYDSPDAYVSPLFRSASGDDVTAFRDANVDSLLALARSNPDAKTRGDQYLQAEVAVLHLGVIVPLAQFRTQVATADRVHGFALASDGTFDLAKVWVEH